MFGKSYYVWGAGLGVEGAAISTASSVVLGAILLTIALFTPLNPLQITLKGDYRLNPQLMRTFGFVSFPVALERTTLSVGQILLTTIIAGLGTAPLAAHHICNTAEALVYLPAYGLSYSATTLIGQALGAKQTDSAREFGALTIKMGAWFMGIGAIFMFMLAVPITRIFTPDPEVITLGSGIFRIVSFAEPFFGIFIIVSGILRGAGDAQYSFWVSLIGMWFLRLGAAYLLAYPLGLGLYGAWIAVSCDLVVRGFLMIKRFKSDKWMKSYL